MTAGLSFTAAIGGMFIPATVLSHFPPIVQSAIGQPLFLGTILVVILDVLLNRKTAVEASKMTAM